MSMMDFVTPALDRIDAYKLGHKKMYPEGTEYVYNNFTPRSEKLSPVLKHLRKGEVVVVGVQRFANLLKTVWEDKTEKEETSTNEITFDAINILPSASKIYFKYPAS